MFHCVPAHTLVCVPVSSGMNLQNLNFVKAPGYFSSSVVSVKILFLENGTCFVSVNAHTKINSKCA